MEGCHARARSFGIRRLGRDPLIRTLSATEEVAALVDGQALVKELSF
jgi:hypothetical protein